MNSDEWNENTRWTVSIKYPEFLRLWSTRAERNRERCGISFELVIQRILKVDECKGRSPLNERYMRLQRNYMEQWQISTCGNRRKRFNVQSRIVSLWSKETLSSFHWRRLTARFFFFCVLRNFKVDRPAKSNAVNSLATVFAWKYLKERCYMLYQKSIEGGARYSIWQKSLTDCSTRHDSRFWLLLRTTFPLCFVLIYSSDDCHGETSNYVMISDTNIWKCELTRSARWGKKIKRNIFFLFFFCPLIKSFFILCGFRWLEINVK